MENSEFNACLIKLKEGLEYYAYSLTNNRDDAKDLVQDTFLKALINFIIHFFVIQKNIKAVTNIMLIRKIQIPAIAHFFCDS